MTADENPYHAPAARPDEGWQAPAKPRRRSSILSVLLGLAVSWVVMIGTWFAVYLPLSLTAETDTGFVVVSLLENLAVLLGAIVAGGLAPRRPVLHGEIAFLLFYAPTFYGHLDAEDLILWRELFHHGQSFVWAALGGWLGARLASRTL